ncbi:hypothetical protein B0H10DRAFT_1938134 [Mycena sp. CBHHK59/15]|nr:hypothetical protein B0H10DRAFT_1938134 [Mycena sp. CBHHK59/15]
MPEPRGRERVLSHCVTPITPTSTRLVLAHSTTLALSEHILGLLIEWIACQEPTSEWEEYFARACDENTRSESQNKNDAKVIFANAIHSAPQSVRIWIKAADLEPHTGAKGTVSAKILFAKPRVYPNSVSLWEEVIDLETSASDARLLLARAVEIIPQFVELWLALARLEPFERAKAVLIKVGKPTLRVAKSGSLRPIYWRRRHKKTTIPGGISTKDSLLGDAVKRCPTSEGLWLMLPEKKKNDGNVAAAREVLERAVSAIPECEGVWLAAAKLEAESGKIALARALLLKARNVAKTGWVWMKAAVFERQQDNLNKTLLIIDTALSRFPTFAKLYMIQGQINDTGQGRTAAARASFAAGLRACPKETQLWFLASRIEERTIRISRRGHSLKRPACYFLGTNRHGQRQFMSKNARGLAYTISAKSILARGPASGYLWSMMVWRELRPSMKSRAADREAPIGAVKIDKERDWFQRAIRAAEIDGSCIGDIWAWWLKYERRYGTQDQQLGVVFACTKFKAAPKHGDVWKLIAKQQKMSRKGRQIIGPRRGGSRSRKGIDLDVLWLGYSRGRSLCLSHNINPAGTSVVTTVDDSSSSQRNDNAVVNMLSESYSETLQGCDYVRDFTGADRGRHGDKGVLNREITAV